MYNKHFKYQYLMYKKKALITDKIADKTVQHLGLALNSYLYKVRKRRAARLTLRKILLTKYKLEIYKTTRYVNKQQVRMGRGRGAAQLNIFVLPHRTRIKIFADGSRSNMSKHATLITSKIPGTRPFICVTIKCTNIYE